MPGKCSATELHPWSLTHLFFQLEMLIPFPVAGEKCLSARDCMSDSVAPGWSQTHSPPIPGLHHCTQKSYLFAFILTQPFASVQSIPSSPAVHRQATSQIWLAVIC